MSNLTLFQQDGQLSTRFQALAQAGEGMDLGEGIRGSYAIVGIKGGRFHVSYKGNSQVITTQTTDGQTVPVASIEVVIVKANPFLNKQYYKGNYVEGSKSPPDCYSLDGIKPSDNAPERQNALCATCKWNQFGSKISDDGKKTKACRDTKKLAIVPVADIMNESMGGAMLFRVPPSSLSDLGMLADAMKQRGFPYNSIAVRIGFDTTVSHPKPTFKAIRPLNDAEADQVFTMLQTDGVLRVLGDNDVVAELAAPAAPVEGPGAFEEEPAAQVAPQAQTPAPAEAPVRFVPPPPPAAVKGMHGAVVQPFNGGSPPPPPSALGGGFVRDETAPVPQAPAGSMSPEAVAARKTRKPAAAPAAAAPVTQGPTPTTMDADIANVLAGLSNFTGGAK
jgi:hypothetical protein